MESESYNHNVTEMFSTTNRHVLIRNNGDKVKADSLKGKMVAVYIVRLSDRWKWRRFVHILEVYEELKPKKDFEIVFVAAVEDQGGVADEEPFNQSFSRMPWLAVPFSDIEARTHLTSLFPRDHLRMWGIVFAILDATGRVLLEHADSYFEEFGADVYPFTPEKVIKVKEEYVNSWNDMSLKSLLGSSDRDFVISNRGIEVPISQLEGKTVGLYMYGSCISLPLLPKLLDIYDKLKESSTNFEIVLVNIHFLNNGYSDEIIFTEQFARMPWLALPFKDKNCKKLWRMFNFFSDDDDLGEDGVFVTISSDGKSVDKYSAKVVLEYGVEAYPFTRVRAAEYVTEKLRAHTINSILSSMNCQFLIKNNGVEISVSRVFGKNILLFIGSSHCSESQKLLTQLMEWEKDINREDRAFEIIYLSTDTDKTSYNDLFRKMPWSAFPFDDELGYRLSVVADALRFDIDGYVLTPVLIAFGPDGRVLTRRALHLLESHGADATEYFTDDQLLKEVGDEVSSRLSYPVIHKEGWEYYVDPYFHPPRYTSGHKPNYRTYLL